MNRLNSFLLLMLLWSSSFTLNAATKVELQTQVESLTDRVTLLEEKIEQLIALTPSPAPTQTDKAASALSNPDQRKPAFSVGGSIKVDLIGNSRSVGGPGGHNIHDMAFLPQTIPLDSDGERNQTSATARASRMWVKASTPTQLGDLGAYIEFDFSSTDRAGNERFTNSYNPRLRHAYATFRHFTVGQTSSTFLNSRAYPEINEGSGPIGILNIRQPMVRYSTRHNDWHWSVAAEQPETIIRDALGNSISLDDDRLPDLIGRVEKRGNSGSWSIATMLRQLRIDDLIEDSEVGYGISTSGRLYTSSANNVRFALTYGKGIGRYINYNGFDDALVDLDGNLEAIPVWSAFLGYQHWWSRAWRSNFVLGYGAADIDKSLTTGAVNEHYESAHLNLLWSPIPAATFGLEWVWGKRQLVDGRSAQINKLQFSSVYKFKNDR